jgi:hypothetical protein
MRNEITIQRERNYPTRSRIGPGWVYLYRVFIPGEPHEFIGTGIGWARGIAKKYAQGRPIVEGWKK